MSKPDRLRERIRELRDQWQALHGEDVNRLEDNSGIARAVERMNERDWFLGSNGWQA